MDALRGKVTTKISREITIAARLGGADPTGNLRLKLALQKARENNIPKENIQRAIQKGIGALEGSTYEELVYEGYGPGGVAVMLEIMTDNRNRTAADIRHIFSKHGGNMGEAGCVSWMFHKIGLITLERQSGDEEELMLLALDAGADDFKSDDDVYEIITPPENVEHMLHVLQEHNITPDAAETIMLPQTYVHLSGEEAEKMTRLIDALEEHDDVQNVYANFEEPEESAG